MKHGSPMLLIWPEGEGGHEQDRDRPKPNGQSEICVQELELVLLSGTPTLDFAAVLKNFVVWCFFQERVGSDWDGKIPLSEKLQEKRGADPGFFFLVCSCYSPSKW